jgi:hypothetical protein
MRNMISMVVASMLACGPDAGDDEDSAADAGGDGSSSTGATTDDGASSADEAAPTSSTSDGVDGSSSSAMASSDDASTGSPCDAGCESLDEGTCRTCPDCTALVGSPWEEDPQDQWCLGASVYLGCQSGLCFSQTHTWCDGATRYELDDYCIPEFGGFDPCEPPIDEFPSC